jgi:hypothetical protein
LEDFCGDDEPVAVLRQQIPVVAEFGYIGTKRELIAARLVRTASLAGCERRERHPAIRLAVSTWTDIETVNWMNLPQRRSFGIATVGSRAITGQMAAIEHPLSSYADAQLLCGNAIHITCIPFGWPMVRNHLRDEATALFRIRCLST